MLSKEPKPSGADRPTPEVVYDELDYHAFADEVQKQLTKQSPKRAKELAETGHYSIPLPKSLVAQFKDRDGMVANHAVGRLFQVAEINGKATYLSPSYIDLAALKKVTNIQKRKKVLQSAITEAVEKNDVVALQNAVHAGLDCHIPEPIEPYITSMDFEKRVRFFRDKVASSKMNKDLYQQFENLKYESEKYKSSAMLSRVYEIFSKIETEPEKKVSLFAKALQYTNKIRTDNLRQERRDSLKDTVLSEGKKNNVYEEFRNIPDFSNDLKEKGKSPFEAPLEKLKSLSFEEFKTEITHYQAPIIRINAYIYFSTIAETTEDKLVLYRQAALEIKKLKTPDARAKNFAKIRPFAPTPKALIGTHQLFLNDANFEILRDDLLLLARDKSRNSKLIEPSIAILEEHKEDSLKNQKLYAPYARTFAQLSYNG